MDSGDFTLREAFTAFYPVHRLAPSTLDQFHYALKTWERCTGNPPLSSVSPDTFDAFRRALAARATITIERTIDRVLSILRCCAERGLIEVAPKPGHRMRIPDPQPTIPALESLSAAYLKCNVASWPNRRVRVRGSTGRSKGGWLTWPVYEWAPQFWRVFFAVSFFSGLRLGDLRKLRLCDFRENVLAVVASKTQKVQSIPIHPCLRRHLDSVTWARPNEPLFPIRSCLFQMRRELRNICTAAGVEYISPQMLRRLSANEWESAWPTAGPAILGHSIVRGASTFYLRPALPLECALPRLRVPDSMLTAEEREHGQDRIAELLRLFERMPADSQELVLNMARRIN